MNLVAIHCSVGCINVARVEGYIHRPSSGDWRNGPRVIQQPIVRNILIYKCMRLSNFKEILLTERGAGHTANWLNPS